MRERVGTTTTTRANDGWVEGEVMGDEDGSIARDGLNGMFQNECFGAVAMERGREETTTDDGVSST